MILAVAYCPPDDVILPIRGDTALSGETDERLVEWFRYTGRYRLTWLLGEGGHMGGVIFWSLN